MKQPIQTQLAEIDAQIVALTARKQALEAQEASPWPKRLTLYAYCSKETNGNKGESLGLTGEALQLFVHFEEVPLNVEVGEDGAVTILACDGRAVVPDARRWTPQIESES